MPRYYGQGHAPHFVDEALSVSRSVAASMVDLINSWSQLWGPYDAYEGEATDLDEMEWYLEIRDDPVAFGRWIDELERKGGRVAAEAQAMRDQTLFERRIGQIGVPTLLMELERRRFKRALRAVEEAEDILDLPKAQIKPPLPPYDPLRALQRPVTQPDFDTPLPVGPSPLDIIGEMAGEFDGNVLLEEE